MSLPFRPAGLTRRGIHLIKEQGTGATRRRHWIKAPQFVVCRLLSATSIAFKPKICYIAFGSNVGDRLWNIEEACRRVDKIPTTRITRTSGLWETVPMYVENQDMFLNGVFEIQTTLKPLELLDSLQSIEVELKRKKIIDKGPRSIDLDILLYDDVFYSDERLTIPHPLMHERTFVLYPLRELLLNTPIKHTCGNTVQALVRRLERIERSHNVISPLTILHSTAPPIQSLNPARKTRIMSILNMTPDSFSDGGKHNPQDEASLDRTITHMITDGAQILDIGGESTRPGSTPISPDEELSRILPTVKVAAQHATTNDNLCISVDTYRASVAKAALEAGAHIINDISAGTLDPDILKLAAEHSAPIILGHIRGHPQSMTSAENTSYEPGNVARSVAIELTKRVRAAEQAGVRRWRILLDPGFGFAKNYEADVELLRDLRKLKIAIPELIGLPWVVGLSRKRFVRRLAGLKNDADAKDKDDVKWWMEKGTDGALMASIYGGADILRVHDVRQGKALASIGDHVWRNSVL